MKFVSGLVVGGFLVATPSVYFILNVKKVSPDVVDEMVKMNGPGVIEICDVGVNIIDCRRTSTSPVGIGEGRYGLWMKE